MLRDFVGDRFGEREADLYNYADANTFTAADADADGIFDDYPYRALSWRRAWLP